MFYQYVVIGAGIMGACTAYEIAKRGHSVLLLEQFDFFHRRGSSHSDSRIIRRTYPEDHYTALMPLSYALWAEAAAAAGFSPLTTTGGLDMGPADNPDLLAVQASARKHGVPLELLSAEHVAQRFPPLRLPEAGDSDARDSPGLKGAGGQAGGSEPPREGASGAVAPGEGKDQQPPVPSGGVASAVAAPLAAEPGAGKEQEPRPPAPYIALFSADAGVLHATKAVALFLQLAAQQGAVLRDRAPVEGVAALPRNRGEQQEGMEPRGGTGGDARREPAVRGEAPEELIVVRLRGGESVRCTGCVVTAGAWARELLEGATGVRLPLQPLQTTVAYWPLRRASSSADTGSGSGSTAAGNGISQEGPPKAEADLPPPAAGVLRPQLTPSAGAPPPPSHQEGSPQEDSLPPRGSAARSPPWHLPVLISYDRHYCYSLPPLEHPDLLKACLHGGEPWEAAGRSSVPEAGPTRAVVGPWLKRLFGGSVGPEPVLLESCLYTMTPDQDFIIDRMPLKQAGGVGRGGGVGGGGPDREQERPSAAEEGGAAAHVVVAVGFSGHGFKFGPLVGRMAADLAVGGRTEVPHADVFSAGRFRGGSAGNMKANGPQVR